MGWWRFSRLAGVKHFDRTGTASKHAISEKHLLCQEKFQLLGQNIIDHNASEGKRLAALKYNKQVGNNRRILLRLIQIVCYMGKQEIPFCGHDASVTSINKGNYLELLNLLSQEEQLIKDYFSSNSSFKGTYIHLYIYLYISRYSKSFNILYHRSCKYANYEWIE